MAKTASACCRQSILIAGLFQLSIALLSGSPVSATVVQVKQMHTYRQEVNPETVDNYMFSTYFSNAKKAYNLRGFEIATAGKKIHDIKINPAGYSFAVLYEKGKKRGVRIKSFNPARDMDEDLPGLVFPTAICYMPDSRQIAVADDGQIKFYNSKTFVPERSIPAVGNPTDMAISPNGNLAMTVTPNAVRVISLSGGEVRKTITVPNSASVAFTPSGSQLGVLTDDGTLTVYSAGDLSVTGTHSSLGKAGSLFFHQDENYAGMVSDGNRIQFVNLYDDGDRPVIYDDDLSWGRFLRDGFGNLYLATSGKNVIKYRQIEGFVPNYGMLLNQMVEERMREWTKMRPGETELEYRERVNEESMRRQRILFANEAASELALTAGLGSFSDITLGRYNPTDGTLVISLGGLNDIYLTVPQEDMAGFGDGNNLQFSDHVFSLRPDNTFELIFVKVYNPTNGKTYTFDNLEGQDLSFLMSDSGFVSLDLIMQSSREDIVLKDIKNRILDEARKNNILSDHTSINVDTHIEPAVDDMGRQIKNYHVDFSYVVDAKGMATEDFAPGKYKIEDSPAAMSLARIIRQAFTSEFAPYIAPGKTAEINITGSADALPINGIIAYDGTLGEYDEEPCHFNGNLTTVTVGRKDGIRTNEQLAFMRAQGLRQNMESSLPKLKEMNVKYNNNIEVSTEKGAEHRRISVSVVFVDAF